MRKFGGLRLKNDRAGKGSSGLLRGISTFSLATGLIALAPASALAQDKIYTDGENNGSAVAAPAILTVAAGETATQSGAINGGGNITKNGGGVLILTGSGSVGGMFISDGTLRLANGADLVSSTIGLGGQGTVMTVTGANSRLRWSNNGSAIGSTSGVTLNIENGGVVQNTNGNIAIANAANTKATVNVSGANSALLLPSSIQSTNGDSEYNITGGGSITQVGGALALGASVLGSAGSGHSKILISGAGSRWQSGQASYGDVSLTILDGGFMSNGGARLGTLAGKRADVLVSGTGSELSISSSLGFGTAGIVVATIADGGKFTVRNGLSLTVGAGGTINIGGAAGEAPVAAGTLDMASLILAGGTLNFHHSDTAHAFDLVVSGTGTIRQSGSGTTILNGANSYAGGIFIDGGTLQVGADGNLGAAANGLRFDGGTLGTTATFASNRAMNLAGSGTFQTDANTTLTLGGVVSGSGTLTKSGDGTLILSGVNTYGGGTAINGGILQVAGDEALGAAAQGLRFDGGTLQTRASFASARDIALIGDGTLNTDGGTIFSYGGAISGAGSLTKDGAGLLVLTGAATHQGGTFVDGGTLQIGNGGTAGSVTGDIVNQGLIQVNRSDALTLDGLMSGTGDFAQNGTGTTILTGDNSYTGATSVHAGTLIINGDQSAATGMTLVHAGARLGGSGTIGGNVDIADGGMLAPGNSPGTLAIKGNLSLAAGSISDFEFGDADVVGGPLNDLVTVGGDLVLDGTLNVSVAAGGSFDAGIYRVFNYDGTLTDKGLDIGAFPGGSDLFVQTSVANQVNLVNTGGLTLNFWDGAAGPGYNGVANGGDGIWQNSLGNRDWTEQSGFLNAAYSDGAFAIFTGVAGQVSVDDSLGAIRASGMQFAVDGYEIGGDAITLTGPDAVIRVGDGTAAGAGMTATIAGELAGNAGLAKADLGTLVLSGTNSYAGGTAINGGTLRISSDANLGDAAGALSFDGGTLHTTADIVSGRAVGLSGDATFLTGADLTLAGVISGAGGLGKDGAGTLILTANNNYTGGTAVRDGRLELGNGGAGGSLAGDVVNDGVLAFNRSDSVIFAGLIAGGGSLEQMGTGTTILTRSNIFTGGTTVAAGTLQIGNGGTTGSITGNVVNNGTLAFKRADAVTFAGLISGGGGVDQLGSGMTILTGGNSYAGATNIAAGTLFVNGDQSLATGLTSVASGATLGGTGIIGGSVTIANGATLAPGAGAPGALAINGNLALAAGATLDFELGRANDVGGPLNDVVNVGGDLVLDGTLDVAVPVGGAFDIGLYRIANYAGSLTDNGLELGTMPAGAIVQVQTAIGGEVNLINKGSVTLNFWDGAAGPKFDNAVNGGDGVWQTSLGNDNWADINGAVNAGYDDGAFAIFSGAAGTVTIDNSLGAVSASGMQFATGGYRITGDTLTLDGAQAVVRVGDGTAAGAAYVATIDAELTGAAGLVKTDAGTLVLSGTNGYAGGTSINGGTLQIGADANLGAVSGGLRFDGGTLQTAATFTSARSVELIGNGSFLTDAGTALTLTGTLGGAGSFTKSGGGTLILDGSGSYGGATVGGGTMYVNGNYAAVAGTTNILAGATLGGTGTIGGNVVLANGALLAPGAGAAGTLTIGGNLSLSATTQLDFEFGEAGTVGGALNDLVNVGGNLVLDGVLNVSVPTGGAFDVGVYRMFNYGGTLTNNGVTLGTMPTGSSSHVQTSIAGQVNLVNSAGLTLNFWDGAAGPKNNGAINGGNGVWQTSNGNDNWTEASGALNAAYADGAFAIFGGVGGTVTVDNSLGAVTAAGMQFAANNYVIAGGAVMLTDPTATIRVGDGSAAGAGLTATINAALTGSAQLVKTDAGTLVLGGTNSYTGGTSIVGGTLRISGDANLGAASGAVTLDGGTLETSANVTSARGIVVASGGTIATAANTVFTYDGLFSGTGALTKYGTGTLLVTGNSSGFGGSTAVAAGTLAVQGSLGGAVSVGAAGRLEGGGRVGSIVNTGVVAPGSGIGSLTVTGDYVGNGGVLEIDAELGGDMSRADRLIVNGATSGNTRVTVINRGGLGGQTADGIKIVDVTGASNGSFALDGDYLFDGEQAVVAGAYGYRLHKNGVSTPQDGDWYLRSALLDGSGNPEGPLYQPGVPVYEAYVGALQSLNRLPTLQQRIGNRSWAASPVAGAGLWGRMESERQRPEARVSTSGADRKADQWQAQLGLDAVLAQRSDGAALVGGLTAHYGEADSRITSIFGNGSIDTQGYGVGATLTWYGPKGFYADGQVKLSWFDSNLESNILGSLARDNKGDGQAFSLELGKQTPIGGSLSVTPQIQMSYAKVDFDRFADPAEAVVSAAKGESLKTRWGVEIDHQTSWKGPSGDMRRTRLYTVVNLSYEWLDGAEADVSGTPIVNRDHRLAGELGLGGSYSWGDDRFTLYTEMSGDTAIADFGAGYNLKGTAGFRARF